MSDAAHGGVGQDVALRAVVRRRLTPRRLVWTLVWTFVGLALIAGIGAWRLVANARATIEAHRARLPAEYAALANAAKGRPALLEPAQEGDAAGVLTAYFTAIANMPEEPETSAGAVSADPLAALAVLPHLRAEPVSLGTPIALRGSSEWFQRAGFRARAKSDTRGLLELSALEITVGADVARRGDLLSFLAGNSIESEGARDFVDALAMGAMGGEDARRYGRLLHLLDRSSPSFVDMLTTERTETRETLVSLRRRFPFQSRPDPDWHYLWSLDVYRAEALDQLDFAFDTALARAGGLPAPSGNDWGRNFSVARILPRVAHARREFAEMQARLRVARTALAVREHLAKTGTLPESLEALVPEILPAVPTDPWRDAPLRYAAGRVWSSGSNGEDDVDTDPDGSEVRDDFVAPPPPSR